MKQDQEPDQAQELLRWIRSQQLPAAPITLYPGHVIIDVQKFLSTTESFILNFTGSKKLNIYKVKLDRLKRLKQVLQNAVN